MEHVTCSQYRLSFFVDLPIFAKKIAIATNNLICFRIPDNKLTTTVFHSIELVDIHRLTCTTTCCTESFLSQTTNLFHDVRSLMSSHNINFVVTFVGYAKSSLWSKFAFQQFAIYWFNNVFFHFRFYSS